MLLGNGREDIHRVIVSTMWFRGVVVLCGLVQVYSEHEVESSLRFIKEPTDTYVVSQVDEVPLDCLAASSADDIQYKWLKKENDGTISVIKNTTKTLIQNGSLIFKSPSLFNEFSGLYQCVVNNSEGLIFSREATLTYAAFYPPSLIPFLPLQVLEYTGLVINCPLTDFSLHDINYKWMKGDEDISPSSSITFTSLDGNLYISEVNKSDAGNYSCQASFRSIPGNGIYMGNASENTLSSGRKQLIVIAQAPHPEPFNIVEGFPKIFPAQPKLGQTIMLECVAFGQLPLSYTWTYNGEPVSDRVVLSEGNRRLTMADAQVTDEGRYACIVVDAVGTEALSYTDITVTGLPIFSLELEDKVALTNSFVKLKCYAYAPAAPVVTWLKDGVPITNKTDVYYVDSQTVILFNPVKSRDEGMFQCAARNVFGTVYSTAKITVREVTSSSDGTAVSSIVSGLLLITVVHLLH